jgi:hypothetical protein
MEPVRRKNNDGCWVKRTILKLWGLIRQYYIFIFYGVTLLAVEKRIEIIHELYSEEASPLQKKYKYKIETFFSVDLKSLTDEDIYRLFEMMNGYVNRAKGIYDPYQAERLNTNYNFHARIAVVINFSFMAALLLCLIPLRTELTWHVYACCGALFFILGHYWGSMFDKEGAGYNAVITDFITSLIASNQDKEVH